METKFIVLSSHKEGQKEQYTMVVSLAEPRMTIQRLDLVMHSILDCGQITQLFESPFTYPQFSPCSPSKVAIIKPENIYKHL